MMSTRIAHALAFLGIVATAAKGCSCGPAQPVCAWFDRAKIVFVGKVQAAVPDPDLPSATHLRVYPTEVITVYRGLPSDTRELTVHPGVGSCRTWYKPGKTYLFYVSRATPDGPFIAGTCSGSREVEFAGEDVKFWESLRAGKAVTSIYGALLQGDGRRFNDTAFPVPGATVTVSGMRGTYTLSADSQGAFRVEHVPPGFYHVAAQREPYAADPKDTLISVPANGCAVVYPALDPRSEISGVVRTETGKPASKVKVQLLHRAIDGTWVFASPFGTYTDPTGRYRFKSIPTGDYLVGYEIAGDAPSFNAERPTRYYPGVPSRPAAQIVHVDVGSTIKDVDFALAPPDARRRIRIRVTWPDGSTPPDHLLQVFTVNELIKNVGGAIVGKKEPERHNGVVDIEAFAERAYALHARYWLDEFGGAVAWEEKRVALTNRVKLEPGKDPAEVRLVLEKTALADELH